MTWFDILMATLWATLAALGYKRGLSAFVWIILFNLILLFINFLSISTNTSIHILTFIIAILGFLITGISQIISQSYRKAFEPIPLWSRFIGLIGGLIGGAIFCSSLTLGLPATTIVDAIGVHHEYPSKQLPSYIHHGIKNSSIYQTIKPVWRKENTLKTILVPHYKPPQ